MNESSSSPASAGGSWADFKDYLRCLMSTLPGSVAVAAAATAAQAAGETVSFVLLVPLLGAVGLDIGGGAVAGMAGYVRRALSVVGLQPTLAPVLAAYIVIVSLQAVVTQWQVMAVFQLEHRFTAALRKRLYSAISRANWLYLSALRGSDLSHVLTQELDRVGTFTYQLSSLFASALISLGYFALAFRLSPAMTLLVTAAGAALLTVLRHKVTAVRIEGDVLSRSRGRLFTTALEHVSALRTAKSHGAEQRHIESFAAAADELADAQLHAIRLHAGSRTWFDVGAAMAVALMLYVGLVALGLSPAGVLLLLYVFVRTMPRLSGLQQACQNLVHQLPSFQSFARLLRNAERQAEPRPLSTATITLRDRIALERVTFAHAVGVDGAIRDISLDVPFGEMTAIVGQSGAGKSTLADLLTGLQRPQRGRVLVDGVPLVDSMLDGWKRQIGYVDQDTFLFNDTLKANLLWANPQATDSDVREALTLAAAQFAFDLPEGLETILGDRGTRLSGGERQRLALARALLRKPRLLVLDEATSALDAENEQRILDAIGRLRGRVAVVLITHRLSAVRDADTIHVLESGRVVESGDWASLNRSVAGRFRALCAAPGVDIVPRRQTAAAASSSIEP